MDLQVFNTKIFKNAIYFYYATWFLENLWKKCICQLHFWKIIWGMVIEHYYSMKASELNCLLDIHISCHLALSQFKSQPTKIRLSIYNNITWTLQSYKNKFKGFNVNKWIFKVFTKVSPALASLFSFSNLFQQFKAASRSLPHSNFVGLWKELIWSLNLPYYLLSVNNSSPPIFV